MQKGTYSPEKAISLQDCPEMTGAAQSMTSYIHPRMGS